MSDSGERQIAYGPQGRCFVCGPDNARGLRLSFDAQEGGGVVASWEAQSDLEGYDGLLHGGIVATLLDEAMAKAVLAAGHRALTCELRVRLRRSVRTGERVSVRGWVSGRERRKVNAEATLVSLEGEVKAHAWGIFLTVD